MSGDLYKNAYGTANTTLKQTNKQKQCKFPSTVDWVNKLCNSIFRKWTVKSINLDELQKHNIKPKKASHRKVNAVWVHWYKVKNMQYENNMLFRL